MTIRTLARQKFSQDALKALCATVNDTVFITDGSAAAISRLASFRHSVDILRHNPPELQKESEMRLIHADYK